MFAAMVKYHCAHMGIMTYRKVEKRGTKYYLYDVTGVWDPVKKNSKLKKKYLGPCDADGNVVEERKNSVKMSKTFGNCWLMSRIAEETGVAKDVMKAFGNDLGSDILALSVFRTVEQVPMREVEDRMDELFLSETLAKDSDLTSREMSRLMVRISEAEKGREKFFTSRAAVGNGKAVIFDVTVFATESERMERAEYGRGYRDFKMKQVNMGMVQSVDTGLPFYYQLYPGSVSDIKTLNNLRERLRSLGRDHVHFFMDRGFFSEPNLCGLLDAEMGFTVPVPAGRDVFADAVSAVKKDMNSMNTHMFNDELFRVGETMSHYAGRSIRTIVYLNEKRKSDELHTLYSRIDDFERRMKEKTWYKGIHRELVKTKDRDLLKLFTLSEGTSGKVATERKRNAITRRENACGTMVIMTTSDEEWDSVLSSYRIRNSIETSFKRLKDDLEGGVKGLQTDVSADGMIFVEFISTILLFELFRRIRSSTLYRKVWMPDVNNELRKLKVSMVGGHWILNEVTKKQRETIEALGFEEPTTADVRRLVPRN